MLAYGLTKDKFSLESAIAAFDKFQATQQSAAVSDDMVQVTPTEVEGEQKMVAPGGAYIPYTMVYDRKNRYASSSTGTSCYCVNCGACKLKATGKMIKPIRVGTTAPVQGSANVTCFRLEIGITDPSGATTWKEFRNTSSASRSCTFSQRGLYTIVFAARDVSTSEAHSMKISHTYKVRVY